MNEFTVSGSQFAVHSSFTPEGRTAKVTLAAWPCGLAKPTGNFEPRTANREPRTANGEL